MSDSTWTWLLFGMELVGITGMLLVGRMRWWGWVIVMLHSVPWLIYSIIYNKPGFIAMTVMWWASHLYNARRWYKQTMRVSRSRGYTCGTVHGRRPTYWTLSKSVWRNTRGR